MVEAGWDRGCACQEMLLKGYCGGLLELNWAELSCQAFPTSCHALSAESKQGELPHLSLIKSKTQQQQQQQLARY